MESRNDDYRIIIISHKIKYSRFNAICLEYLIKIQTSIPQLQTFDAKFFSFTQHSLLYFTLHPFTIFNPKNLLPFDNCFDLGDYPTFISRSRVFHSYPIFSIPFQLLQTFQYPRIIISTTPISYFGLQCKISVE